MTLSELLPRLDAVRERGTGRWTARCPAHEDRTPSLSIAEGDRGLLIRCWAGCCLEEIVAALGINLRDLFYDSEDHSSDWRETHRRRTAERQHQKEVEHLTGLHIDTEREAERLIQSARDIGIGLWFDARLDTALNHLADAYDRLERSPTYE